MFNLSEKIKEKFEALTAGFRPQLALADGDSILKMGICTSCSNSCSGSCSGTCKAGCGNTCSNTCSGSCRGSCSGSCQRYQR